MSKRNQSAVTASGDNSAIESPSSSNNNNNNEDDHLDKRFKQVKGDEDDDDDDDDEAPKNEKRAGRRKIKIEYIEDKSRRHITFSKRKSGIMKKAYELSTLTGTQVLLLVVSETGLVYTFTTPKLQPLVTKNEGKNLIQACLHAPDKASSPDSQAQDPDSPAPEGQESESDDRKGYNPSPSSPAQQTPLPPPQQQQQQPQQQQPPPHVQQQQQHPHHPPPPPQQHPGHSMPGPPTGAYGSSSAMNMPTYPPPYSHIPFPTQYSYPSLGMHYPNAPNQPPPHPQGYGGGNQYWSGPGQPGPGGLPQSGAPPMPNSQAPMQQQHTPTAGPPSQTSAQAPMGVKTERQK